MPPKKFVPQTCRRLFHPGLRLGHPDRYNREGGEGVPMQMREHGFGEGIIVEAIYRRGQNLTYGGWFKRGKRHRDVVFPQGACDSSECV